jgi:hypothetical protein
MDRIPINRETMQKLNQINEDELKMNKINTIVRTIYDDTVCIAKNYKETLYNYQIPFNEKTQSSDIFYIQNIDIILNKLKELFPGCSVSHALLARGKDDKLYDISKIDDKMLLLIDTALNNSYIVIDWSI